MDEATKRKTYFLLAATTIIWGIQPLCIKWLVTTWSPVTITAMRYYLIGTTLLALSVYRGERLLPPRSCRRAAAFSVSSSWGSRALGAIMSCSSRASLSRR